MEGNGKCALGWVEGGKMVVWGGVGFIFSCVNGNF